jgi:hypothetical protein
MENPFEVENKTIMERLQKERSSYGKGYKPDARQAAEMYKYTPSEYSGFVSERPSEMDVKSSGIVSEAERSRFVIQDAFLSAISRGYRKSALDIAINSEDKRSGIPISYFYDVLERDRLLREAYAQDNPQAMEAAVKRVSGPTGYRPAIPEEDIVKTTKTPLEKMSTEGYQLTPQNLKETIERNASRRIPNRLESRILGK